MNDRLHEGRRPGAAAGMTSLNGGVATAAGRLPAREIRIPELYRRPLGDRELQGCLKSRA